MTALRLPLNRRPPVFHAIAALTSVAAVALSGFVLVDSAQAKHHANAAALLSTDQQLATTRGNAQRLQPGNFLETLPQGGKANDVVRDISRYGQAHGIQIASLSIQTQPASASELGRLQLNLAMNADYRAAKAWLGDLLNRHPSLGVQQLAMRSTSADSIRQEVLLTLVFFVKD